MSAAIQVFRLMFSLGKIQRWLIIVGLTLVVLSHAIGRRWSVLSLLGVALILIVPAVTAGFVLRAIAAPRAMRLAPHARLKMWVGSTIMLLAAAFLVTANAMAIPHQLPPGASAALYAEYIFLGTLGFGVLAVLGIFATSASPGAMVWLALLLPASRLIPGSPVLLGNGPALGQVLLVVWIAFGLWFLTVRRISLVNIFGIPGRSIGLGRQSSPTLLGPALTAHRNLMLLGQKSVYGVAIRSLAASALFVGLQVLVSTSENSGADLKRMLWKWVPFLSVLLMFKIAWPAYSIGTRCRLLWLTSGSSRAELFLVCERTTWRLWISSALLVLILAGLAWMFIPHPPVPLMYLLPAMLLPSCGALYLGLCVKGWPWPNALYSVMIAIVWWVGVTWPIIFGSLTGVPWLLLALELLGVGILRALSRRQWEAIDWTARNLKRLPSQSLRPVV